MGIIAWDKGGVSERMAGRDCEWPAKVNSMLRFPLEDLGKKIKSGAYSEMSTQKKESRYWASLKKAYSGDVFFTGPFYAADPKVDYQSFSWDLFADKVREK